MKVKFKKVIKVTLVCFSLLIIGGTIEVLTPVKIENPHGNYSVGTKTIELTDSLRNEDVSANKSKKRRLIVQFWYPAKIAVDSKRATYHPNPEFFQSDVAKLFPDIPQVFLKRLANAKVNSYENAPIISTNGQLPVIIFSHGMDAMRSLNSYQMEELASNGYVIASIEHVYSATGTVFKDGTLGGITPYEKIADEGFAEKIINKWSMDQSFVFDQLEKMNKDSLDFFYAKLDLKNVGLLGFSFGGCVVANTLTLDKRIKAGVNLDGFYYGENYKRGFNQSFMELRSQPTPTEKVTEAELKASHLSKERWDWIWFKEWKNRLDSYTKAVPGGCYSYTITGADHFSFCDLPLMAPFPSILSPKTERIHELTNQYTLSFFNQELKGMGSNVLNTRRAILK